MFRMWAKIFKDNRLIADTVICNDREDTRTHKVFQALDEICYEFDLGKPIWLDATIAEFKRHDRRVLLRTTLLKPLILIIWKSM